MDVGNLVNKRGIIYISEFVGVVLSACFIVFVVSLSSVVLYWTAGAEMWSVIELRDVCYLAAYRVCVCGREVCKFIVGLVRWLSWATDYSLS